MGKGGAMNDPVEHPCHYEGEVECIDAIRVALGEGFSDYCRGNAMKYIWRCDKKGKLLEDLCKARQYLTFAIDELEGK
jgi:hypothetical protein